MQIMKPLKFPYLQGVNSKDKRVEKVKVWCHNYVQATNTDNTKVDIYFCQLWATEYRLLTQEHPHYDASCEDNPASSYDVEIFSFYWLLSSRPKIRL